MATDLVPGVAPETPKTTRPPAQRVRVRRSPGRRLALIARNRWLYVMLLPGVAYFLIFKYWPMYGLHIAFKDYVPFLGYADSPWVGLKHFE